MTNIIPPYSPSSSATQAADTSPSRGKGGGTKNTTHSNTNASVESVTLSAAAQANAALVNAAHNANGVDQNRVNAIKEALANGSYNVSPDDLAHAISSVLSEVRQ